MKRMVILYDSIYNHDVRAHLANLRIQYLMFIDLDFRVTRLSVPHAVGARFLFELRRSSIPYELI